MSSKHSTWFKRLLNPILRKLFRIEITSLILDEEVIGYGIRKQMELVMKGKLILTEGKWFVEYQDLELDDFKYFPLDSHSELLVSLRSDRQPIHIIGERVEFKIEQHGYAKLTKCNGLHLVDPKSGEYDIPEKIKNSITEDIWIPSPPPQVVDYLEITTVQPLNTLKTQFTHEFEIHPTSKQGTNEN